MFKPEPDPNKKVETRKPIRTRKKLIFKPEPDPISGLSRVGQFSFRVPDAGLCLRRHRQFMRLKEKKNQKQNQNQKQDMHDEREDFFSEFIS